MLTKVHAGGKFDHDTYKVSGGLHGVGVTVVNALSEWLEAEIHREGQVWRQDYERGEPRGPVRAVGPAKKTGTKITFLPDHEIFPDHRLRPRRPGEAAPRARLPEPRDHDPPDRRAGDETRDQEFYSSGGLGEFVAYLNRAQIGAPPAGGALGQRRGARR